MFISPVPCLVSVTSDYEPEAAHKKETLTISLGEFTDKLKFAFPDKNFGKITKKKAEIKKYSKGRRAKEIQVGSKMVSGAKLRPALALCSSRMEISMKGSDMIVITKGAGRGVGMSHYGASGMAGKGKSYKEILRHYYKETKVSV